MTNFAVALKKIIVAKFCVLRLPRAILPEDLSRNHEAENKFQEFPLIFKANKS